MKKTRKRNLQGRRRRRGLRIDGLFIATVIAAVIVLQLLVFCSGVIAGQHEVELRAAVYGARVRLAEFIAPPPAHAVPQVRIAHIARLDPPPPVPTPPVELIFTSLPPIERPRAELTPMIRMRKPDFYLELIHEIAERNDVPASLVEAVVRVESDFNARLVSHKGARGLMQVLPATAARFGVDDPDHLFYPAPNLNAGTAYLAWLLKRYEGDLDLALAAYNAGEGAVDTYRGIPPYRETREYVKRVRRALARMKA